MGNRLEQIQKNNFKKFKEMNVISDDKILIDEYKKIENKPYMPLSIDRLGNRRIAMAHNRIQNGDVMADPDMEIDFNFDDKLAMARTYQNDGVGVYQEVEDPINDMRLQFDLDRFLDDWTDNLINQGFFQQ